MRRRVTVHTRHQLKQASKHHKQAYTSDHELDEAIEAFKKARLVSIMMGTHVKLGQHSALIQLSDADDCIKMVVKMVEEG